MGASRSDETTIFTCQRDGCNEQYPSTEARKGYFCSDACYYVKQGEPILEIIARDHVICSSCHRQLKTIEKPSKRFLANAEPIVSQAIIGFEYSTQFATNGIDVKSHGPYTESEFTRLSCKCGAVDPNERTELLDQTADGEPANRLFEALCHLAEKGAINVRPEWDKLKKALESDEGLAYAVGKSLEG